MKSQSPLWDKIAAAMFKRSENFITYSKNGRRHYGKSAATPTPPRALETLLADEGIHIDAAYKNAATRKNADQRRDYYEHLDDVFNDIDPAETICPRDPSEFLRIMFTRMLREKNEEVRMAMQVFTMTAVTESIDNPQKTYAIAPDIYDLLSRIDLMQHESEYGDPTFMMWDMVGLDRDFSHALTHGMLATSLKATLSDLHPHTPNPAKLDEILLYRAKPLADAVGRHPKLFSSEYFALLIGLLAVPVLPVDLDRSPLIPKHNRAVGRLHLFALDQLECALSAMREGAITVPGRELFTCATDKKIEHLINTASLKPHEMQRLADFFYKRAGLFECRPVFSPPEPESFAHPKRPYKSRTVAEFKSRLNELMSRPK